GRAGGPTLALGSRPAIYCSPLPGCFNKLRIAERYPLYLVSAQGAYTIMLIHRALALIALVALVTHGEKRHNLVVHKAIGGLTILGSSGSIGAFNGRSGGKGFGSGFGAGGGGGAGGGAGGGVGGGAGGGVGGGAGGGVGGGAGGGGGFGGGAGGGVGGGAGGGLVVGGGGGGGAGGGA
ncbi:hypothetical protein Hamer_G022969, partial [Homarus americanus]